MFRLACADLIACIVSQVTGVQKDGSRLILIMGEGD